MVDSLQRGVEALSHSVRLLSETLYRRQAEVETSVRGLRTRMASGEVATDSLRLRLDTLLTQAGERDASLRQLAGDLSGLRSNLNAASSSLDTLLSRTEGQEMSIRGLESGMSDQLRALSDASSQRDKLATQIRWLGLGGPALLLLIVAITVWVSHRQVLRRAGTATAGMVTERVEAAARALDRKLIASDGELAGRLTGSNVAENHDLALKVADEVTRMEGNLDRMDANIRGYKQLRRSLDKIRTNLGSAGYELVPHLGKSYDLGLLVEVEDFIFDDSLPEGQSTITRVFRPEVRFGGQILQAASIQVTEGPEAR